MLNRQAALAKDTPIPASSSPEIVVVIGGGSAGACTALVLARKGHKVRLVEKGKLFSGTSGKTPGRLGLGFHYDHPGTAVLYLSETLDLVRNYPGHRIGEHLDINHPLRRGRYFIMKDSQPNAEELLKTYEKLREKYREEVVKDPSLIQTWGSVENFFRILKPAEYENTVDISKVAVGIETAEHLLDWVKFSRTLEQQIRASKNITVYEDTEVCDIRHRGGYGTVDNKRFLISTKNPHHKELSADFIVNATWENIKVINALAELKDSMDFVNRTKALATVQLPIEFENSHSMFMCMGPYCMFTNMGGRIGKMTFAPVTNISVSTATQVGEREQKLIAGYASDAEKNEIGKKIIKGVSQYIPGIEKSILLDVAYGVIQTLGTEANIYDPKSSIRQRNYSGVRDSQIGWISAPAMKLIYGFKTGEIVAEFIGRHVEILQNIQEKIDRQYKFSSTKIATILRQFTTSKLEDCQLANLNKNIKNFHQKTFPSMQHKARLNDEFSEIVILAGPSKLKPSFFAHSAGGKRAVEEKRCDEIQVRESSLSTLSDDDICLNRSELFFNSAHSSPEMERRPPHKEKSDETCCSQVREFLPSILPTCRVM